MNTLTDILMTLGLVVAVALAVAILARLLSSDGYGHRPSPRSHEDDVLTRWYDGPRAAR